MFRRIFLSITFLSIIYFSVGQAQKLPIVYHPDYNISFCGVEKLHPFDSKKYGNVYNYLVKELGIKPEQFSTPEKKISDKDLLSVHSQQYLDSLKHSSTLARIAEIPMLRFIPNFMLQRWLLNPMRYATQGTIDAAFLALRHGWSVNLSGGYHHAKQNNGEGFCVYADIPLACKRVLEKHPKYKILIVDLDAHQGNGHEMICGADERIAIFDIYNADIYPQDKKAQAYIDFNYPVHSGIKDEEYLLLVQEGLERAIEQVKPDLIIYNAGTDIFEKDPLGRMNISEEGIIMRDELVFSLAWNNKIPVAMVLSGGYTQQSAHIISKSLENLLGFRNNMVSEAAYSVYEDSDADSIFGGTPLPESSRYKIFYSFDGEVIGIKPHENSSTMQWICDSSSPKPQPATYKIKYWSAFQIGFGKTKGAPGNFILFHDKHGNQIKKLRYNGSLPVTKNDLQPYTEHLDLSIINNKG